MIQLFVNGSAVRGRGAVPVHFQSSFVRAETGTALEKGVGFFVFFFHYS